MLKRMSTLAIVIALVLVASGVALAQIGVFDAQEQAALQAGDLDTIDDVDDLDDISTDETDADSDDTGSDSDENSSNEDSEGDLDEQDLEDDSDDETVLLRTELSSSGPFTYQAGEAGTVRFAREGSRLLLLAVEVNPDWYVKEQEVEGDEIEIEFHNCDTKVEFEAELDDEEIELEVKSSPDDHHDGCFDQPVVPGEAVVHQAAEAGTVTIIREGSSLKLGPVTLNAGWYVKEQEVEGDEIEIEFHNESTRVEFTAEYDDGQIKLEVESSPDDSDD